MKRFIVIMALCLFVTPLFAEEQEVAVECEWGTIRGTLMTPDNEANSDLAALIIAGSGPTDRNCNSAVGLRTNAFAYLAQELGKFGVASLRYDKRGIGASRHDGLNESDLRFDDYIDDAARCVEYLTAMGYKRVLLIGHSEGSQIALAVAAYYKTLPIAGLISLSGAAHTIDYTLKMQLTHQLVAHDMGMMMTAMRIIDDIKAGKSIPDRDIPQPLLALFRESVQAYLCSSMNDKYAPQRMIHGLTCPILVVGGGMDVQVPVSDAEALHQANRASQLVVLPSMSHTLKDALSRDMMTQRQTVYIDSSLPLSGGLVDAIGDFVGLLN